MSICLFVGKDSNSKFLWCTQNKVRKIVRRLLKEGVREFWAEGRNEFESGCIFLTENMSMSAQCFVLAEDACAVGFAPSPARKEYLGKWANAEFAKDIPPAAIVNALKRLLHKADYIVAGMEHQDDCVAVAEYGRALGKTVYTVFA